MAVVCMPSKLFSYNVLDIKDELDEVMTSLLLLFLYYLEAGKVSQGIEFRHRLFARGGSIREIKPQGLL